MAATLSVRPDRLSSGSSFPGHPVRRLDGVPLGKPIVTEPWRGAAPLQTRYWRRLARPARTVAPVQAGSRADDSSAPFEMSVESALKLLGVSEGASFEDILRAKNSIVASCKGDHETIKQSLSQRRAGKVVNSSVRYADVKRVKSPAVGSMPQWLQSTMKNSPVSIVSPSTSDLGLQAGVYGALMGLTYINGTSTPSAGYAGADVPGLILAGSFGASLYFMTKKNVKLGKATVITIGGLIAGAVVGSAVENWLQVDIVPFMGIHSPAAVVSEIIIISQFLVSLYLR
ncbi:protein CHAPERONE-LIKE PROTEIN OF POR1, chloroplastic isoform X2 [Arachis ipaensis]|uniref:protein CHAPERONE-LIKE PROTEIN OF POR1, chloroplastic isoform X2 n=1 Tax=Arachis ipaensis TaxID=130454 RepID=UPI000A2B5B16|nr:protein CHAPERONE-LIKE PROTEIN OF POR1, chloroplastic isoform X2 [Arachis ipaensis]XP_025675919.1 protein CHAPERONE-LIKE PROTEIN OF POR1, chloroplastic isoform X2 [Arachis hypogaea]